MLKSKDSPYGIRGYTFWGIILDPNYLAQLALFKSVKKLSRSINGGKLLDFGCGNKPYEFLFKNRVDEYIGVDIEVSGHDHHNEQIDFFWDGKTLPFEDASFDHVLSTEVIEHVFDLDDTLDEIRRVMRPGGDALITIPFAWEEHEKPYDNCRYTQWGLEHLMKKHGFEIINRIKSGTFIHTIFQMKCCYWEKKILIRVQNPVIYHLLSAIIVTPITIRGLFWSRVLPDSDELYMNNVIYVRKVD